MASSSTDPPLLYARLWEDHRVLRDGLRLGPDDDVFSIAAAGDNGLALLLDDPRSVTVLDRNTTQLALVHLKLACLRNLEPQQARRFLGMEPATDRLATWARLRDELPDAARAVWDSAHPEIEEGVLNTGKFERYLALFRRRILPLVQSKRTLRQMAALTDLEAQRALYTSTWNSWRWRLLFRMFFSRFVMERRGRDKAFFEHVQEASISDVFLGRAKKALCDIPVATNPYLVWILTGQNIPLPYLTDAGFETISARLDRLTIVEDDLGGHLAAAPAGTYSAHNLSDCFEYMSQEATDAILGHIVSASRPGARLVYWNLLVPRDGRNIAALVPDSALATRLHATDPAFFYGRLHIETVR